MSEEEDLDLASLSVAEDDIAKLVPERIFSLEVHPSPSRLLVAAGDTWGRVGLWDVDSGDMCHTSRGYAMARRGGTCDTRRRDMRRRRVVSLLELE